MFKQADVDNGGTIGLEEFVGIIKSCSGGDADAAERVLHPGDMLGDYTLTEDANMEAGTLTGTYCSYII